MARHAQAMRFVVWRFTACRDEAGLGFGGHGKAVRGLVRMMARGGGLAWPGGRGQERREGPARWGEGMAVEARHSSGRWRMVGRGTALPVEVGPAMVTHGRAVLAVAVRGQRPGGAGCGAQGWAVLARRGLSMYGKVR